MFMANPTVYLCGAHAIKPSRTSTHFTIKCPSCMRPSIPCRYYLAAAGCVLGGLRAKTQMQRALPMLALFGVRFLCLGTRIVLNSGSQAACMHYAVMEVRPLMLKRRAFFIVRDLMAASTMRPLLQMRWAVICPHWLDVLSQQRPISCTHYARVPVAFTVVKDMCMPCRRAPLLGRWSMSCGYRRSGSMMRPRLRRGSGWQGYLTTG